ncbi:hypothetical protein A2996_02650 [Candidatus Campbellbacteria bacterium RIFCSPLOWO2_01_FULL_34_15]|uniref:Orotidine 5'-phosphate decarboxylase domain-containing protein n=2 Tax=Candidatus Campbelliibacteriota TaxID=1752727 RepID=A0A1F5EP86_9BACT|nr:MAG: hypothetical protein A2811_00080 [Candidatus Campbellbacteria bacterium RIFCSPHIGHO2_01_FULL_34_10]OGD69211.1 MAG: hypothetical protein A2996_02650 [Candidatus Campbellbacteria bacterium RIFCSPLOWO2_01_FULL_34_15]
MNSEGRFISITDFTCPEQVNSMLELRKKLNSKILLGVGVMMSYKTLHGFPTKWSKSFPENKDIPSIFMDKEGVFNVLHYADQNNDSCWEDFWAGLGYAGPNVHAIQFDMTWPHPNDVHYVISSMKEEGALVEVIMQVGRKSFLQAENTPKGIIKRLSEYYYRNCLDYVLLDKSMGEGKILNPHELIPFIDAIYQKWPNIKIVVAGGLGPETISVAEPILDIYPISLCAQSRLRPSFNALDPIDWDMAQEYWKKADALFKKYEK